MLSAAQTLNENAPRGKIIGECYGEPAAELALLDQVAPTLEKWLQERALTCYLATYFGCRLDNRIARAGIAKHGPGASPFRQSKVTIIEQTADRVVADVNEADFNDVIDGELIKDNVGDRTEFVDNSRYTIVRDAKGVWRISDRKPTFDDWECRPR